MRVQGRAAALAFISVRSTSILIAVFIDIVITTIIMASSPGRSLTLPRPRVAGVTDAPAPLGHDQDLAGAPAHGTAGPHRHSALALAFMGVKSSRGLHSDLTFIAASLLPE